MIPTQPWDRTIILVTLMMVIPGNRETFMRQDYVLTVKCKGTQRLLSFTLV
jgi:hypothetical protein